MDLIRRYEINPNVRKDGESFKQYRLRLKNEQFQLKHKLKGKLLWDCMKGNYVRSRHSLLGDI